MNTMVIVRVGVLKIDLLGEELYIHDWVMGCSDGFTIVDFEYLQGAQINARGFDGAYSTRFRQFADGVYLGESVSGQVPPFTEFLDLYLKVGDIIWTASSTI